MTVWIRWPAEARSNLQGRELPACEPFAQAGSIPCHSVATDTCVCMLACMNADLLLPPAALLHSLQALVLSHEKATEEEMVPYLLEVLRPLKPVVIYGRTADLPPKMVKKEAVY